MGVIASPGLQAETDLCKTISKFYADPLSFVFFAYPWGDAGTSLRDETGPETWQRDLLQYIGEQVKEHKFDGKNAVPPIRVAISSGHGVGKSTFTAWLIHWIMSTRPFCRGTVTANTSEQLKNRTWAELAKWTQMLINRHWFIYHNTRGNMNFARQGHKETWFFSAQTCREENSEAFAGQHAANSTSVFIFDEASAVPDPLWNVAEGGLTDGEPMIFVYGNPTRNTGMFHACFHSLRHRWHTKQIDSREVPRTNDEQIAQWIHDYGDDSDFVRVRVKGVFPNASSLQFVPTAVVQAAMDRELNEHEYYYAPKVMGVDVARYGDSQTVICKRQGLACHKLLKFRELNTMEVASIVSAQINEWDPDAVFIDECGLGAGVVDRLFQIGQDVIPVNVGVKAGKEGYSNLRAQIWGDMRDWLKRGASLPSDNELLMDLTGLEYGYTPKEQIRLERKEDAKKRGIPSPDSADALALTFTFDVDKPEGIGATRGFEPGVAKMEYDLFASGES